MISSYGRINQRMSVLKAFHLLACTSSLLCPLLSLMPPVEPVSLPDRVEEQRSGEDSTGERGRGVEGLLWRCVSGDSGWVCHEIRSGVHLSGHDVSTASDLWPFTSPICHCLIRQSEGDKETGKERWGGKWSSRSPPQQNPSFLNYWALGVDWLFAGLVKRL